MRAPLRSFGRHDPTGRPPRGALVGSLAFHLALIGLVAAYAGVGPRLPDGGEGPAETVEYLDLAFPEAGVGTRVAAGDPAEAAQSPPAAPAAAPPPTGERPERAERTGAPGEELVFPSSAPAGLPQPDGVGQPDGGSGGSPLRPGIRDPRLFATQRPVPAGPEQTPHEEYMGRLGATLGEYHDSVAAERARARDAADWTRTGEDGSRWGISPGRIHLGGVTIPLQNHPSAGHAFGGNPQAREEAGRETRQRGEIDRQAADRSLRERARATRERKRAERP
ncbi:MAG TPA: hypothetical protein VGV85_12005 [Longimicrobiaceae bacterium]|nr:hypothetical protein [Longimicrobiaceae bacterium]